MKKVELKLENVGKSKLGMFIGVEGMSSFLDIFLMNGPGNVLICLLVILGWGWLSTILFKWFITKYLEISWKVSQWEIEIVCK